MEIEYADERLKRLAEEVNFDGGYDRAIVRAYRMRIQFIAAALDERAFRAMKSLHFEKLKGDMDGFHSMRLNAQWRLILKFKKEKTGKLVMVISIMDYH